jgi:hypothetical protein
MAHEKVQESGEPDLGGLWALASAILNYSGLHLLNCSFLIVWGCHVGQVGILDSVWHHLDSSLQEFLLFM